MEKKLQGTTNIQKKKWKSKDAMQRWEFLKSCRKNPRRKISSTRGVGMWR